MKPDADHPPAAAQPVLDYQDPAGKRADRLRSPFADLLHALAVTGPGCLVVAAVLIIMFVYAMIALAVLSRG